MNIIRYLHRRATYFNRLKIKKEAIREVLVHDSLPNEGIINIHRTDPANAGDYYCGPHHYFNVLRGKSLDIFDYKNEDGFERDNWSKKIISNSLIIGGGGLLCLPGFSRQMKLFEKLKAKEKKTVIWGAGHNSVNRSHFHGKIKNYNVNTSAFGLVGVRDYSMKEEWVPCVSCLHPIFDRKIREKRETGVILHKKNLNNKRVLREFKEIPSIANNDTLENIVKFIGETQTVITSSYHAMYWAMLLGKKVVVFPSSSKFFDFKYQPVISNIRNYKSDIKKAQSYSGVLEECRTVNINFANKVFDYLGA